MVSIRTAKSFFRLILDTVIDIVSFANKKLSHAEDHNSITMLLHYSLVKTEQDAMTEVCNIVVLKTGQLSDSSKKALGHPALKESVQVR